MKLIERIVRKNIQRYLNEMDVTNRRESKNVDDRRNEPLNKYEIYALNLCRKLHEELVRLKMSGKSIEFFNNAEKFFWFGGEKEWIYAYRLSNINWEFPNSGDNKRDFQELNDYLNVYGTTSFFRRGEHSEEFHPLPLCKYDVQRNCVGVADWIFSLEYHLNRVLPKQNDVMQKNCTRDGTIIRRAARR